MKKLVAILLSVLLLTLPLLSLAEEAAFDSAAFVEWFNESNLWMTVANGHWSTDPADRISDAELETVFSMATKQQNAVHWTPWYFIVIKDTEEQRKVIGDYWDKPENCATDATVTVLCLADQILTEELGHATPYSGYYMPTTFAYYDSGLTCGLLGVAAAALGYQTHYFGTINGEYAPKDAGNGAYQSLSRYVSSEDIATGDAAAAIADDAVVKIATVKSDSVNIKKGASEKSEVLFKAESGDSFIVTDVDKYAWANIELVNGEDAYVSAIYVDMEDGFREAVAPDAAESLDASIAEFNGVAPKKAEVATGETADGRISDTVKTAAGFTKAAANDAKADDKKEDAKSSESTVQNNDSQQTQEAKNEEPAAAEPVEEPAQEPQQVASNDDLYLLAAIVFAESGGESYDGQLAVANVVLNRQRNGYWGSSLADVIYSPSQFTGCQTSAFRNALSTGGSASCLQAAQDALAGNNNIGSCMYFRPTWVVDTSSLGSYTQIGNHIFW